MPRSLAGWLFARMAGRIDNKWRMLSGIPVPLLGGGLSGPSSDLDRFKGYNCCHVIDGNEVVGLIWMIYLRMDFLMILW